MPLPADPTAVWPPQEQTDALRGYRKWAAWWSGDVDLLAKVYAGTVGYADPVIDGRDRRAMVALQPRSFHGAPAAKGALKNAKLHIPLAADIATTSADLLFGEPPVLVAAADDAEKRARPEGSKQSPTQDRLDYYMANGLQAVLIESAEIASAFGGVYIRVGWDTAIADHPLFDAIPPDAAVPDFRSGVLTAVTFHRVLRDLGDGKTWRHLERHEPGKILHGLYASGDDKTLGVKRPLKDHPETEPFAALMGAGDMIVTGAEGLAADYIPNMRPNRRLRGSQLGRSDFDGIESIMDSLDEAWSSWMRDLRIGKGRILLPEVYLESQGRGQGALFDAEQEVFQLVNALPGSGGDGLAMQNVQFNIRVAEHQQTTAALLEQAVRGAGYSAQSFGMQGDGQMATATEVNARQSRSFMTRGKKVNYYRPPLARIARAALQIDVKQFKPKGVSPVLPDVEWPDGIAVDPQTLAQTLQLLRGAEAASTRTLVEMLHPDWDDTRVGDEVKAIEKEGEADQPPPAFPGTAAAAVGAPAVGAPGGSPAPGKDPARSAAPPAGKQPATAASGPGAAAGRPGQAAQATTRPAVPGKAAGTRPVMAAGGRR